MRYDAFAMSKNRRYDQYCPVCHALELVGERWSLVIVRELLKGPKRYTDLIDGMPGVGTNILASRLRELEAGGIVEKRRLPPPAASTVYELTEYGRELEPVMLALGRWGARSSCFPGSSETTRGPGCRRPTDRSGRCRPRRTEQYRWEAMATRFHPPQQIAPGQTIMVRIVVDVFWKSAASKPEKKLSLETYELQREPFRQEQ